MWEYINPFTDSVLLYAVKGFSLLSVINIISDVKCLD